jgi:hypothetical protein
MATVRKPTERFLVWRIPPLCVGLYQNRIGFQHPSGEALGAFSSANRAGRVYQY